MHTGKRENSIPEKGKTATRKKDPELLIYSLTRANMDLSVYADITGTDKPEGLAAERISRCIGRP